MLNLMPPTPISTRFCRFILWGTRSKVSEDLLKLLQLIHPSCFLVFYGYPAKFQHVFEYRSFPNETVLFFCHLIYTILIRWIITALFEHFAIKIQG